MIVSAQAVAVMDPGPSEDEIALSSIEDEVWQIRSRLRNDTAFAVELSAMVRELLASIHPHSMRTDCNAVMEAVRREIEKIPPEKIDLLSLEMFEAAERMRDPDGAKSAATRLLAGWLKAGAIEDLGEDTFRRAARQLKADCELFFARLLLREPVTA